MTFWIQHIGGSFKWQSADGYYGISEDKPGEFMAHHIEALWARPDEIGLANTLKGAQDICDQHRQRTPAPV